MPTLAPPLIPRKLDSREENLDELFMRWNDVTPVIAGSKAFGQPDFGSGEEGCALMPLAWNLSYRKLEVLMRYMSHVAETGSPTFRAMHTHLCEWYGRGTWKRQTVSEIEKLTRKKYKVERMVFHGGSRGNPKNVLEALEWVSGHFPGEVYLPMDFTRSAQEQMNPKRKAA